MIWGMTMICCVTGLAFVALPPLGPNLPVLPAPPSLSVEAPSAKAATHEASLRLEAEPLDRRALRDAAGGTADYAIDLGALGVNVATTTGTVTGLTLNDTQSGDAIGTNVLGNAGITTVFVNTGNGVVLQNTVQVNVFTGLTE